MCCESKAATDAAARVRAAVEQASQASTACARSPAAADKQPATLEVVGARGHSCAASSSAALAAGRRTIGDDPEILVLYSGESDSPSESKSTARSSRKAVGPQTTTAKLVAVSILTFVMSCSAHSTSLRTIRGN